MIGGHIFFNRFESIFELKNLSQIHAEFMHEKNVKKQEFIHSVIPKSTSKSKNNRPCPNKRKTSNWNKLEETKPLTEAFGIRQSFKDQIFEIWPERFSTTRPGQTRKKMIMAPSIDHRKSMNWDLPPPRWRKPQIDHFIDIP